MIDQKMKEKYPNMEKALTDLFVAKKCTKKVDDFEKFAKEESTKSEYGILITLLNQKEQAKKQQKIKIQEKYNEILDTIQKENCYN